MRRSSTLLLLTAVAACVAPPPAREPPPPPRAMPAPPAPPRPAPVADWRDRAVTPGTWVYDRDARGTRAVYGRSGADALLVLRCDRMGGRILLSRAGTATAPLTIRTTGATRVIPVQPTGGTLPYTAVTLTPNDPLLDAMAFSRGKLVVEQPGAATLVLPAWAEIGRVVEDCRG